MFEPVTITRSTSAGGAPAGGGPGAAGAGNCADAFDAKIKEHPTLAMKAARRNPSLFSTFLVISFSIGLVRFLQDYSTCTALTSFFFTLFKVFLNGQSGLFVVVLLRLLEAKRADKLFFRFF